MNHWKTNIINIWFSQFLSLMGFYFAIPFAPFYLQELGITDPTELKIWVSIFAVSSPLAFAICAPIWGHIADRYGRRPMLLRATLSAAIVLTLMGKAESPEFLIICRIMQGILTGTMVAAQTMVSVLTPKHHRGTALGALSTAVFTGTMSGIFIGGIFAETFGYRNSFFISGLIMLGASLFVLFGTKENFKRPAKTEKTKTSKQKFTQDKTKLIVLAFLFLLGIVCLTLHFDTPWIPLLVQEIHQSIEGAAFRTGLLGATTCVAGILSCLIFGRLSNKKRPPLLASFATIGAGLFLIPQGAAQIFERLLMARFGMAFFSGGLDTLFQIWLSRITPEEKHGVIFGWASSARSCGLVLAPIISGLIASTFGVRYVFFTGGFLFLCLTPIIMIMGKKIEKWLIEKNA